MNPAKTTPKDFFLWLGALITLCLSTVSLITLLFSYINVAFPDALAYYGDPYASGARTAMAMLIVFVPATIVLFRLIRGSLEKEPAKADIWARRWGLILILFVAGATVLIDLVTIVNSFLDGEIGMRFFLKAAVVLLVATGIFLHFFADVKGYWLTHTKKANLVGIGVGILALASIIAGFFIIGTPGQVRDLRLDAQRVSDIQGIQYQVLYFWQSKATLPADIEELNDPLSSYLVPSDPETGVPYRYERTSGSSFNLCAVFSAESQDMTGQGQFMGRDIAYPSWGGGADENWKHPMGEYCFSRTIDPERYPPFEKPVF